MVVTIQELIHNDKHSNYPMLPEKEKIELELARRNLTNLIYPISQTDQENPPEDREKLPEEKWNWPKNN